MIVALWTGRETTHLRRALRMTIAEFADLLGVSTRTVDNWEARGADIEPRPEIQRALDTLLSRADPGAQLRLTAHLSPLSRSDAHAEHGVAGLGWLPATDALRWLGSTEHGRHRDRPTGRSLVSEDVAEGSATVRHREDFDHRGAEEGDPMRRRTLIQALAASPLTIMNGTAIASESRILGLERHAESLRRLYHSASSPEDLLSLAVSHLDATVHLMRELPGGALKRRTLRNRSEVATLAGRLAFFDLQQPTYARGYFGLAHESAVQVGDDLLAAAALGHLAFIPAAEGSVSAGIDYLTGARDCARRAKSSLFQSWIEAITAELLTATDPAATLRSLDRGFAALAIASQIEPPSWFDYYSADRLDGFRGRALLLLGRHDEARGDLSAALSHLMPSAVKQRAVFQFDVASSHLTPLDPQLDLACGLAIDAARVLAAAGYATGGARLSEFRARLQPWQHDSVVADFEERLVEVTR